MLLNFSRFAVDYWWDHHTCLLFRYLCLFAESFESLSYRTPPHFLRRLFVQSVVSQKISPPLPPHFDVFWIQGRGWGRQQELQQQEHLKIRNENPAWREEKGKASWCLSEPFKKNPRKVLKSKKNLSRSCLLDPWSTSRPPHLQQGCLCPGPRGVGIPKPVATDLFSYRHNDMLTEKIERTCMTHLIWSLRSDVEYIWANPASHQILFSGVPHQTILSINIVAQ